MLGWSRDAVSAGSAAATAATRPKQPAAMSMLTGSPGVTPNSRVRAARTLLFGVTPGDPTSLLLAAVCFGIVSAFASALPALAASRLQPTVAIREE